MHKISDLINLLEVIDLENIKNRLSDVHRFVTILSVFQSLVILRKPRYEEHVCFRGFFKTNDSDMNLLNAWLEKLKHEVELICSQTRDNENCLQVRPSIWYSKANLNVLILFSQLIEMLDLNILHFMKQILKTTESSQNNSY